MDSERNEEANVEYSGIRAEQNVSLTSLKPKCPYYPEADSNLYCPYFMMSSQFNPAGYGSNRNINWFSIVSLILGIIAIVTFWLSVIIFIFIIVLVISTLAIVFGSLGLRSIRPGAKGRGAAIAGNVLGIISLVLAVVFFCIGLMLFSY